MFIDLGSEAPNISDDEIGEPTGTIFSSENLFDIQDSDGENVEFIISSGESSDEETSQQRLPEPRNCNSRNPIVVNGYSSRAIDRVERDCRLGTLYENETDSAKAKSDIDQDNISQPSSSTESPVTAPRMRKYSSAKHPGVILQDSATRKWVPTCRFKDLFKNPMCSYFFALLAYIAFMCLGSLIFILIEKPDRSQSGLPRAEILESLYDCHCLSPEKLAEILTELSNAPPSKLRKYITHITNKGKLSTLANHNETRLVDTKDEGGSWSFGNALFFCVTVVTTIGYGHIVPLTYGGKVYSVIFACIGIPFTLYISSSVNNHFLIPAVNSFRKVFVDWIDRNHKPKKSTLMPAQNFFAPNRSTFLSPLSAPPILKINGNGVASTVGEVTARQRMKDLAPTSTFSPARINGVNQNVVALSQPSVVDAAMASGEVNESFDDADMNVSKSNSKSKSVTTIVEPNPSKMKSTDFERAVILDPKSQRPFSTIDRGGLSDFTERRKISRKHYSTISKTSIFVNMRLKHFSPINDKEAPGKKMIVKTFASHVCTLSVFFFLCPVFVGVLLLQHFLHLPVLRIIMFKQYSVVQPPLNILDLFRVVRRNSTTRAQVLFLLLMCAIIISITMILPAVVFTLLEPEWTYVDALYFCFISITTIGFGDFVPGQASARNNSSNADSVYNYPHQIYLVTSAVYLITGATLMMLMVRTYRSMMELERKAKRDRLYTKLQHSFTDPILLNAASAPRLVIGRN